MMGKFAYWFVLICAVVIIIMGIGMFAIGPYLVTIPMGAILTVIGMVIIRHMSRYETYDAWLNGELKGIALNDTQKTQLLALPIIIVGTILLMAVITDARWFNDWYNECKPWSLILTLITMGLYITMIGVVGDMISGPSDDRGGCR